MPNKTPINFGVSVKCCYFCNRKGEALFAK